MMPDSDPNVPFDIGDVVRVKEDVEYDDELEWDIAGWQGRVAGVTDAEPPMLLIEWDSVTLDEMSPSLIEASELEGLDWGRYYVFPKDVEVAEPRDSPQDVKQLRRRLHNRHHWVSLGEEGRYIQQVLARAASDDEPDLFRAWETVMERLSLPFDAKIAEYQEAAPLRSGDEVRVLDISFFDCLTGLLATVRHGRETTQLPLADLEALDETSDHSLPLRAYRTWVANH